MARKLSPLTAQLVLDINKWTAGIKQVAKDQEAIKKALKPLQEQTKQLGTVFVAAGAAVGGAMLAMAKKAADFGDEMLEASQKTGLSTKSLSAFRLLAEQSGTSFDGITAGVGKLSRSMFESATKGGEAAKTFAALGISVKDSSGRLREAADVLPQIADRFASMRDGTEKTALAMKLFGKAGADLIPLLNQGADGIRNATELTEKYSVSLTEAEAKLGDDFNDALAESKTAMMGLALQIGNALLPAMTKMVAVGNNVIAMVARWAKENPGLTRTIAAAAVALTGTGGLLLGMSGFMLIAPKMIANVQLLAKAFLGLSVPLRLVVIGIAAVTAAFLAFPQIRGPVLDVLQKVYQGVTAVVSGLSNLAFSIGHFVKSVVSGDFSRVFDGFRNIPQNITEDIEAAGKRFTDFVGAIKGGISEINAATQVKGFGKDMAVDLAEFGKEANKTKDLIDQMWASLKRENAEADALVAVLMRAKGAHIDINQVLDKLGPTIADVAEDFKKAGEPLPEIIQYYDFLRRNALALAEAESQLKEELQAVTKAMAEEAKALPVEMMAKARQQIEAVEVSHSAATERIVDATVAMARQRKELQANADAIKELARRGYTLEQIEDALGVSIEKVAEKTKDQTVQAMAASKVLSDSWEESLSRLSDQLVDMIVDFDFSFRRLKDIAVSTAKDMARAFLDGFFKPFKDGLRDAGEAAGRWASSLIFGTKQAQGQQQGQGGLGGILGGGIFGGIFGGGGGAATPPIVGPTGGGGTVQQGGFGQFLSLNPAAIFSAGFGAVKGVAEAVGKGRDSANEIIKAQNAFIKQTLKGILDDANLSASNKLKLVMNEWETFQGALTRFAAGGGENPVTANQAFATVSPLIANIQRDLMKEGASLNGGGSGEFVHNGDVVFTFALPSSVTTPEQWLDWWDKNKAGIRARVAEGVFAMEGAIVAR